MSCGYTRASPLRKLWPRAFGYARDLPPDDRLSAPVPAAAAPTPRHLGDQRIKVPAGRVMVETAVAAAANPMSPDFVLRTSNDLRAAQFAVAVTLHFERLPDKTVTNPKPVATRRKQLRAAGRADELVRGTVPREV